MTSLYSSRSWVPDRSAPAEVGPAANLRAAPSGASRISAELFGAVQAGYGGLNAFGACVEELGLSIVRWPGGGLAEGRPSVYGLDVPGILDRTALGQTPKAGAGASLPEMLAHAVDRGVALSMVIPTARYADDVAAGVSQLAGFVGKLLEGDFGPLPETVILEIGDEYSSQAAFYGKAGRYGKLASQFVETIADVRSGSGAASCRSKLVIGVQMGVNSKDDQEIRAQMSVRALASVGALTFRHLPINLNNAHAKSEAGNGPDSGKTRFEKTRSYFEAWCDAILSVAPQAEKPRLFLSSWTVGSTDAKLRKDLLPYSDYGLRGASTALDLLYNYSRIGLDMAAVWGIGTSTPCVTTGSKNGNTTTSPMGAILNMMRESLVGTVALPGGEDFGRDRPGSVYAFRGADRLVFYIAVNQVPDEGGRFTLSLEHPGPEWKINVRTLDAVLPAKHELFSGAPEARLHELPVIRRSSPVWTRKGLSLKFDRSFSVIEVTMIGPRHDGFAAGLTRSPELRPTADTYGTRSRRSVLADAKASDANTPHVALASLFLASGASALFTLASVIKGGSFWAALGVFYGAQIFLFAMLILVFVAADRKTRRRRN